MKPCPYFPHCQCGGLCAAEHLPKMVGRALVGLILLLGACACWAVLT